MSEEKRNDPPLQRLQDGAVHVKIWRQESKEHGSFPSVTVGRTYKDPQTGDFKEARGLVGTDILKAQALLLKSYGEVGKWQDYFREQERQKGAPEPESSGAVASRDAALDRGAPEATPQAGDMAQQRDAAMANAAPAGREPWPGAVARTLSPQKMNIRIVLSSCKE